MTLDFRVARTDDDLRRCFWLRGKIYSQVNYMDASSFPDGLESDKYDPYAVHFIAEEKSRGEIVGTARLILESPLGFPFEELYDISSLRVAGKKIAEVSRRVTLPNHVKANLGLLKMICQGGRNLGITDFICSVNPADIDFYLRIGMVQIGELKHYGVVNNPALGMHIELDKFKKPYDSLFFKPSPDVRLD